MNVLIADGRKLLREGIASLLAQHDEIRIVGEADDVNAAIKLLDALDVRVLLLNLSPPFPPSGGVPKIREIRRHHPKVRIVALTYGISAIGVKELLAAGATACLSKDCSSVELLAAIRSAADNRAFLSPSLTSVLVTSIVGGMKRGTRNVTFGAKALSHREKEVLGRLASGQSTKEIAAALEVGTKTVETHRRRIMEKTGLWTVAELTQLAMVEGLVLTHIPRPGDDLSDLLHEPT